MEEEEDPQPPPPPPPRLRAPPALPDEVVEEILLRSPPDDPARLVRAALVCKRWSRLVSDLAFRRRFRDFHLQRRRGAPMLGFLHNECGQAFSARFVRTSASCPPLDTQRGWQALDARGGRVLLHRADQYASHVVFDRRNAASPQIRLAVWDPLSAAAAGSHLELPVPILPRGPLTWNAALLCCDQHGRLQVHADGPFRVVLVGMDAEGTFVCVYSSGPASWSEPSYAAPHPDLSVDPRFVDAVRCALVGDALYAVRGALVGDALYFLFQRRTRILKYDLAAGDMSVIGLPPASPSGRVPGTVLTTTSTEGGGLGFARVEGDKLCLWSMEARPSDGALAMEWTQHRVIDLRSLLPVIDLLGFADGLGMILVGTIDGLFSIDQKSGRIDKLVDGIGFYSGIVPYLSFYTPALGTASTNEGPSANA